MRIKKNLLRIALIVLISTQFLFVIQISAQPVPIGDTVQANPYESNPNVRTALPPEIYLPYEMVGPLSAGDGSFDTYARWEWHPSLPTVGYYELTSFDNTPTAAFTIGWVDLKVSYKCPATMNDKYRIVYRVGASGWQVLQDWVAGASAQFDYNGQQSHRAFSDIAEPLDGVWDWTDINNVEFRVEIQTVLPRDTPTKQFFLYEVWLTIYEGSYPPAGPGVSFQPSVVLGLGAGETFFVDVFVTDVVQMHGFQFVIRYNPLVLTAIDDYFAYNPFILKAPSAVSELTYLSVNGFDNSRPGWARNGTSPYLGNVDYPTNYINETADGETIGDFSFDDLTTPNYGEKVYIELNATSSDGDDQVELWLYDGTTWTLADTVTPPATWPLTGETWTTSVDVGPILDTMTEINNAKVYLVKKTADTEGEIIVDAMRLSVTLGRAAISFSSWMGDPTGFTGSGPVMRIYFTVDAEGYSLLHFDPALLADIYGTVIAPLYVNDGIFASSEVHDVAVTDVRVNATQVMPGESVEINVTVMNQGAPYPETFDVTVLYNTTAIDTKTVTSLDIAESETLNFIWDTTGVPAGHYLIKAVADTVPGETETGDNTLEDGMVIVGRHDVAVTNVVRAYPTQDVAIPDDQVLNVTKGEIVYLNATVSNLGDFTEKFNVTLAYIGGGEEEPRVDGEYFVETRPDISLASGASQNLTFAWNTTTVIFKVIAGKQQNYTECGMLARVTQVPYETNTTNNKRQVTGNVNVTRGVEASFDISPTVENDRVQGSPIRFESTSYTPEGTEFVKLEWDFGDGTNQTIVKNGNLTVTVWHTYTQSGTFNVTLRATNNLTQSGTYTGNVTILALDIATTSVTRAYPTPDATIPADQTIKVTEGEIVYINVIVANQGDLNETVIVTIYYDDTEIETSIQEEVWNGTSKTFSLSWNTTGVAIGVYTVKAEAKLYYLEREPWEVNKANNVLADGTVTIIGPPVVSFNYTPSKPAVGETVTFDASASYDEDGQIEKYEWDFGDGTKQIFVKDVNLTTTATHTFAARTTYTVSLTLTDNDALSDTTTQNVTIYVHDVAVTAVTASPTEVVAGESVTISVSVANEGDFDETFNLTVKYDDNDIESKTVDLEVGTSTTLPFVWDTGGVGAGNYTIKAVATVAVDNDPNDNTGVGDEQVKVEAASNIFLYVVAGVAIVGIAIAVIAVYLLRFRKPKPT